AAVGRGGAGPPLALKPPGLPERRELRGQHLGILRTILEQAEPAVPQAFEKLATGEVLRADRHHEPVPLDFLGEETRSVRRVAPGLQLATTQAVDDADGDRLARL